MAGEASEDALIGPWSSAETWRAFAELTEEEQEAK